MSVDFSKFEAVSKAEAAAAGLTQGLAHAPAAEPPVPAPAAPAPVVIFADGGPPRRATVPLTWPVVVAGVTIAEVVVRRLRVAEVRAYVAAVSAGQEVSPPMYETIAGEPLPNGVLDSLDQDDFDRLDAAAVDFLPLALRGDPT